MADVNYDRAQLDLVIASEKPHEFGLRSRGISGSICSRLLRDFLRTNFPTANFDEGIVCKQERKGTYESGSLSPQCDIIAYHGSPWESILDYVVVPLKNVFFVIEVKKWIEPSDLLPPKEYVNQQVVKQKSWLNKPVLLVAYRHDGGKEKLQSGSKADRTYLFSSRSADYPDHVADFSERHLHKGELARLVEDVAQLLL